MRRSEAALLILIVFFIAWLLVCMAHPFAGLVILCGVFVVFLGFLIFIVAGLVYLKRR